MSDSLQRGATEMRHPAWLREALACLPMSAAELEARIASVRPEVGPAPGGPALENAEPGDPARDGQAAQDGQAARNVAMLRRANAIAALLVSGTGLAPVPALADPELDDTPTRIVAEAGERAARRLERALRDTITPVVSPAALSRPVGDLLATERIVEDAAERLRSSAIGDLLAAGFAPLEAPSDVDWAAAALETFEQAAAAESVGVPAARSRRHRGLRVVDRSGRADTELEAAARAESKIAPDELSASAVDSPRPSRITFGRLETSLAPSRAPGWLWARIRGDVQGKVRALNRRRLLVRSMVAAAVLVASALLWVRLRDAASHEPNIVFQRVDSPLASNFSTNALIRSLRRGS